MTYAVVRNGSESLYLELEPEVVMDLLRDITHRYESLFTFSMPIYKAGKGAFLFSVLRDGYGAQCCDNSIGLPIIDLATTHISGQKGALHDWSDEIAGRVIAKAFASTLGNIQE
ncbi:hypothetical protein LCGC14_0170010 [marine sediment metagenome]|jgi:hypothetical protein|uniref:Uncharacterized protein n=1 Tax=marine sediment metagenome TaxID=412755 RepID=A0A0F9V8I3_9ZZZZ